MAGLKEFDLALRAARLATHAGFDRLIALPMVRDMVPLEHQIRTATTVLRRFRGRALHCDEVGLGKTIEAGLVVQELLLRHRARTIRDAETKDSTREPKCSTTAVSLPTNSGI